MVAFVFAGNGVCFGLPTLMRYYQYCFNLAQRGQSALADEILRHILISNGYSSGEWQNTIRIAICGKHFGTFHKLKFNPSPAIAIQTHNYAVVLEQCRKLMTVHQFNNEPLRLLLSFLSSGLRPTDAFITSTLQKHLFREIKLTDAAVNNPETLKWNAVTRRWGPVVPGRIGDAAEVDGDGEDDDLGSRSSEERPDLPTKSNPVIIALYGQICIAARSYQSALCKFSHKC